VGAVVGADIMSLSAARPSCPISGRTSYPGIPAPGGYCECQRLFPLCSECRYRAKTLVCPH